MIGVLKLHNNWKFNKQKLLKNTCKRINYLVQSNKLNAWEMSVGLFILNWFYNQ